MQISLHGFQEYEGHTHTFPYEALNPISNKKDTFNDIEDVHNLLVQCYDECIEKGFNKVGNAIYDYSRFFTNDLMLIDEKIQAKIKSYRFRKKFNCPPFPSLEETPIDVIDSFMIIDDEITQYKPKE